MLETLDHLTKIVGIIKGIRNNYNYNKYLNFKNYQERIFF